MTPDRSVFFSVVLPCRNQADHIGGVLEKYIPPLDATGRAWELIVVPNACTDSTVEAADAVAARRREVRVLENPAGGWGRSVLMGLRAAVGEVLCYANSARTDPALLPGLLRLYEAHAPCVAKVVRCRRGAPLREAGSWLYNLEAHLLFGVEAPDINGTPKLFPRSFFEQASLESSGDLLDLELMVKAAALGLQVAELPVEGFSRHGGKSSTNLRTAWGLYGGALRMRLMLGRALGVRRHCREG
ncbi:MAG: glycosyltransferase [Elusimicrobiota bacterium]|jgi:glycosyltransferase involved in cell wall biosynthesis